MEKERKKVRINVTLNDAVVKNAKLLGVNVSDACNHGLMTAVMWSAQGHTNCSRTDAISQMDKYKKILAGE